MTSRQRPVAFKDWKLKELKEMYVSLDNSIYGANPCYGCKDMQNLMGIEVELNRRGYSVVIGRVAPKIIKVKFDAV